MGKKWFIYRRVEEFAKDVNGLGVDVPMDAGRSAMFRPVHIGRLVAGNAWAIHPMEGCDGAADGAPDELTFRRYRRFGAGGAKLIWGEATAITLDARANPRLEDRYVEAARIVARLGYDFVDIKQCHRYLMNELLSGRDRPGRYGGSFENRTRFARNVFGKIRDAVGDRLVLATRLNVFDGVPFMNDPHSNAGIPRPHPLPYRWGWGANPDRPLEFDLAEPLRFVGMLRDAGVELIDVSMGNPYANYYCCAPSMRLPGTGTTCRSILSSG